jgi:hypothetical protein
VAVAEVAELLYEMAVAEVAVAEVAVVRWWVAVDAWQWDSRIEEVGAVRMVPDTVWHRDSGGMKWQWMGGSGRGGSGSLVAGPGVAVDGWQWDEGMEEVGAVRMVPDTVWQWQWWRSCCMKWQWQRWQWQRWQCHHMQYQGGRVKQHGSVIQSSINVSVKI